MNTANIAYEVSLIPGAILSRLLYRGNAKGGEVTKMDTVFMIVTSYSLYLYLASLIIR